MPKKRPPKLENLIDLIRECIGNEKFTISKHALSRQNERKINVAEVLHVLITGYEDKKKTCFDEKNNVWKYAIKGKTKIDKLDVRIIVTFEADGLLIITVMHVGFI